MRNKVSYLLKTTLGNVTRISSEYPCVPDLRWPRCAFLVGSPRSTQVAAAESSASKFFETYSVEGITKINNNSIAYNTFPKVYNFDRPARVFQQQQRSYSSASLTSRSGYVVKIQTGSCRSAGTPCGGTVSFMGDKGESEYITLGDSSQTGFETGTTHEFHVQPQSSPIGALRGLRIKRDAPSSSIKCNGWFIETVEVQDLAMNEVFTFPVRCWLGQVGESSLENRSEVGPVEKELWLPSYGIHEGAGQAADQAPGGAVRWMYRPPALKVHSSASAVPHPAKVKQGARAVVRKDQGQGGEDAYFNIQHRGVLALGVSDGVYMWRTQGIDAGEFSRGLMTHAAEAVMHHGAASAKEVMSAASDSVTQAELKGSATVCIITVDLYERVLKSANLGDSGFAVIRNIEDPNPEVLHITEPQEHEFGRPFQLGHHEHADNADAALCWEGSVQEGDVIIIGSDGLWDNVHDQKIFHTARSTMQEFKGKSMKVVAKKISDRLTELAYTISTSTKEETPYSRDASEAFDMIYSGGKKDDICVLVAILDHQ